VDVAKINLPTLTGCSLAANLQSKPPVAKVIGTTNAYYFIVRTQRTQIRSSPLLQPGWSEAFDVRGELKGGTDQAVLLSGVETCHPSEKKSPI
jgi:hypothetical protein